MGRSSSSAKHSSSGHSSGTSSGSRSRRKSANSTYPCLQCGELYSRPDNLRVHQRMHSGAMPYRCKYCQQPFRWMGALRSHENSHKNNPNFKRTGPSRKQYIDSDGDTTSSDVVFSDVDPGVGDFATGPWHDVLEDWDFQLVEPKNTLVIKQQHAIWRLQHCLTC